MLTIDLIGRNLVDGDGPAALANVTANRRFDDEFIARFNAEIDVVADLARDPPVFGHARDDRETHAGRFAHGIERGTHRRNALNQGNVKFDRTRNFHCELCRSSSRTCALYQPGDAPATPREPKLPCTAG